MKNLLLCVITSCVLFCIGGCTKDSQNNKLELDDTSPEMVDTIPTGILPACSFSTFKSDSFMFQEIEGNGDTTISDSEFLIASIRLRDSSRQIISDDSIKLNYIRASFDFGYGVYYPSRRERKVTTISIYTDYWKPLESRQANMNYAWNELLNKAKWNLDDIKRGNFIINSRNDFYSLSHHAPQEFNIQCTSGHESRKRFYIGGEFEFVRVSARGDSIRSFNGVYEGHGWKSW